ncbi:MAG: NADPH-dependent oxidoreductase [Candidatus Hydrogenedens sp.]|nr:NADPH-dependent oxidoreductase [Candidatus Hydrogenedens sp.]
MSKPFHVAALIGSLRPDGYSRKALAVALDPLVASGEVTIDEILPETLDLAFPGQPEWERLQAQLVPRVAKADGVLIATPEYNGSYSSTLKVQIDGLGYPSALQDKPVAMIGVASGRAGAIRALEHVRSVCGHLGALLLPPGVSVPSVERIFSPDGECLDEQVERLLRQTGQRLLNHMRTGDATRRG